MANSVSDSKRLIAAIKEYFSELTGLRRREVIYLLINVVTIALCAVVCGAGDFVVIAKWGGPNGSGWRSFLI